MEILTAGIWLIFRGLKFPPNNEIGENSHLWMGTNSELRDLLRMEIAKVCKLFSEQRMLIATNEQYISMVANPANNKLLEIEKKLYVIERDISIILVKDENMSAGKNKRSLHKRIDLNLSCGCLALDLHGGQGTGKHPDPPLQVGPLLSQLRADMVTEKGNNITSRLA